MEKLLQQLGYTLGDQATAEMFIRDWAKKDFDKILEFVQKGGNAFQDIPFSLPHTYEALDEAFPDSRFILTIRDSAEIWWQSMTKFHSKLFGKGKLPGAQDLRQANYRYPGWAYETMKLLYKTDDDNLYDRKKLTEVYNRHNQNAIDYFADHPEKLLVINLRDSDAASRICQFLGSPVIIEEIPWENASTFSNRLKQYTKRILRKR